MVLMDLSFVVSAESVAVIAKNREAISGHWKAVFRNLDNAPDEKKIFQYTSREFLVNSQLEVLKTCKERTEQQNGKKCIQVNNSVISESRPSMNSEVELNDLNKVEIQDLTFSINKQLDGKFLLCRNITQPLKINALTTIVDDPSGKAVRLSLYNFSSETEDLQQIMPIGAILAIKNPFFKSSADGGFILRCDDSDSVVYLGKSQFYKLFSHVGWKMDIPKPCINSLSNNTELKSYLNDDKEKCICSESLHWKNLGNQHFQRKDFISAVKAYTTGLQISPLDIDLLSNRCAAYLNLCWFICSFDDAESILQKNPHHLKAICRKAKTLCGMNKCKEAVHFLSQSISELPNEMKHKKILEGVLDTVTIMKKQQESGNFPVEKLKNYKFTRLENCAEFIGPVKVRDVKGKGRGVIATKKISAGSLIVASRSFEIDFNTNENKNIHFTLNQETKSVDLECNNNLNLIQRIAQRLTSEQQSRSVLYDLFAGPKYLPREIDMEKVDVKLIKDIYKFNSFQIHEGEQGVLIEGRMPTGIWIFPSYINNSCADANCTWDVYGDFMFIRACKDIRENEEILISYLHPTNSFEFREKRFKEVYEFTCLCSLCEDDRNDLPSSLTRNTTLKMFYDDKLNNNLDIGQLNRYLDIIRSHPRDPKTLNSELLVLLVEISMQYIHKLKDHTMAALTLEESYSLVNGSTLVYYKVNISKYLIAVYIMLSTRNSPKNINFLKSAKIWAAKFKDDLKLAYGKNVDIGEVVSKTFLNFARSEGVQI